MCKWGGGARVYGRVLRDNTPRDISNAFILALGKLEVGPSGLAPALACVNEIIGLGISFASKHLRFLRPEICPVLDSRIREELGYKSTSAGYAQYAADCLEIARVLENNWSNVVMVPRISQRKEVWTSRPESIRSYSA